MKSSEKNTENKPESPEKFDWGQFDNVGRFKAKNFLESLSFARDGLYYLWRTERNFRIDVVICFIVTALGIFLNVSAMEWGALVIVMGLVLCMETMNTVIEHVVDLYTHGEFDMRAKVIKDVAASACLLGAVTAAIAGTIIFLPKLLKLFM